MLGLYRIVYLTGYRIVPDSEILYPAGYRIPDPDTGFFYLKNNKQKYLKNVKYKQKNEKCKNKVQTTQYFVHKKVTLPIFGIYGK